MVLGLLLYLKAGPWLPAESKARAGGPHPKLQAGESWRIFALLVLVPILGLAHLINQQLFNVFLVWGDERFDMHLFSFVMPTTWLISFDAAIAFAIMGGMVAFWKWYAQRRREPDELGKMIIGSVFTVSGGLLLTFVAAHQGSGKIPLYWPLAFIVINEIGFANISPVSLALFSRLAPAAIGGTVIGIFYLNFFLSNKVTGIVGGWYQTMSTSTFWLVHVAASATALLAFVLFKLLLAHRLERAVSAPA
jgi:POT family proton-dependent oligopeptide transporter